MSAPQKLQDPEPTAQVATWTLWLERGVQALLGDQLGAPAVPPGATLFPGLVDVADLLGEDTGPGRVVLAATPVGLLGREGALMRPALLVAGAGLAAMSVVPWGWLRWL